MRAANQAREPICGQGEQGNSGSMTKGVGWPAYLTQPARHDKMVERMMIADSFRTTADDEKENPVGAQA